MDEILTRRLELAKGDNQELNRLIAEYLPFIKSETAKTPVFGLEFDDRLSIALLVFMNCARNYEHSRGAFLPFAATCIRNRLIDEGKKHQRQQKNIIHLHPEEKPIETDRSVAVYHAEQEREMLAEEIDRLGEQLRAFGIAFGDLSEIGPKQKRSRGLCVQLARETVADRQLKAMLLEKKRLSVSQLAARFKISQKTVEKHRKYIVTIAVILSGDYPGIQAFLPEEGEVKQDENRSCD